MVDHIITLRDLRFCFDLKFSVHFLTFSVVTAGNKEVLSGSDAIEISCKVTGITAKLKAVKWTNSGGTDVSDGDTSYTFNAGSFGNDSQTTTLTVEKAENDADKTYSCVVTPADQDDATEVSTPVKLNVFSELILSCFLWPLRHEIIPG